MLSAGWLVAAVVVAILLTGWVTFTLTRLDRLHARLDAAQAALDAQLVRRAAALLQLVQSDAARLPAEDTSRYERAATAALATSGPGREAAENEVGRAITCLADHAGTLRTVEAAELRESCVRVAIARRFYNDAVRDTRGLRARQMPRLLHLAGHREMPQFFDIDDTATFPETDPDAAPASPEPIQESST